ncbi:MAG: DUF1735 domain-containing protein [Bacteroidales bacterium]|mgnify:CR=1 FL=1|jgi:hypothetical protein|nr:DUF1735 domain-containing protein [Bacteroidales bacterium]
MAKKLIIVAVAALALLTGCNKSQFIIYEDIPSIYYFSSPGVVFIRADSEVQTISVSKGGYPKGNSSVSIEVSTAVLIAYNTVSEVQYDLMPAGLYSIESPTLVFNRSTIFGEFEVKIKTSELSTLTKGWYAIPLKLTSGDDVKTGSDSVMLVWQKL